MKNNNTKKNVFFGFIFIYLFCISSAVFAQATNIIDFVLYAGNGGPGTTNPGAQGYGVILGSGAVVNSGRIGAKTMVKTLGQSAISASINSGGKVALANGTSVTGSITAANSPLQAGTTMTSGTNSNLLGRIEVAGNIIVNGGIVSNTVTHPLGTTYMGPIPLADIKAIPTLPTQPSMPPIVVFPAAGITNISTTQSISPGSYGNLILSGNKVLTLNGPGTYIFNTIKLIEKNQFVFDFQNNPIGEIKIYVHGNVNLAKFSTIVLNGGNASRIFLETHGNGVGSATGKDAFIIASGNAGLSSTNKFIGTVWAPYGAINLGSGSGASIYTGAFYSGTQIITNSNITINYQAFVDCAAIAVNTGNYGPFCTSSSTINLIGTPSGGTFSGTGVSGSTFSPSLAGAGNHLITYVASSGTCTIIDTSYIQVSNPPTVSAGVDTSLVCNTPSILLQGSSSTINSSYAWTTTNGVISMNANTNQPTITLAGTYVVTLIDLSSNCSATDTVEVTHVECILPGYEPPPGGKNGDIIGADLTSLNQNFDGSTNPNEDIFTLETDSIWVEIIYNNGMYNPLYNLLLAPPFNATTFVDNGNDNRVITTIIKVIHLDELNNLNVTSGQNLINYVRPLYKAVIKNVVGYGITSTLGDLAQRSAKSRAGFQSLGDSVKIGVISNSYNTQPGNQASIDVGNGDLPGVGNLNGFTTPVQVLREFPYGMQNDEGRAMLQIIHDIAPKASLAFCTGFISAGNMAEGIKELEQANCDIIVDDVTFITEPFLQDGVIAQAVNDVHAAGVTYFTSAGNFGDKAYEGVFTPAPAPGSLAGSAHNFGGGDVFQNINLTPGKYLLVLQWKDDFYSIETNPIGTQNDLDIYLTDNSGNPLFGFNRNNSGGDPIEVLPFTVTGNTNANIVITRTSGVSTNIRMKYIFFRGTPDITNHVQGTSTIVGQANAIGAITTGAVLYLNTPAFNVDSITKASFSSIGGTQMSDGTIRNKPDLCAPNGGNTTVELGGPNIDSASGDIFPNFFGTSAAAPHAAAVAALLLGASKTFYGTTISPDSIKNLLISSAKNMYEPGFDFKSGYGFIDAYDALLKTLTPKPKIDSLEVPVGSTPGQTSFTFTIHGENFLPTTGVLFRDDTLVSNVVNDSTITAIVPTFTGNPPIRAFTAPISNSGLDGGISDSIYFFGIVKQNVVVNLPHLNKKFGEAIPTFTPTITVNNVELSQTSLTLQDIGLDNMNIFTPANAMSNVSNYIVVATPNFNSPMFQELFNYTFEPGILTIQKMPLIIRPNDLTVQYGDKINGQDITFLYTYDSSQIAPADTANFADSLLLYENAIQSAIILIDDRDADFYEISLDPLIQNMSLVSGSRAVANGSRAVANGSRAIANNSPVVDTIQVIDVPFSALLAYDDNNAEVDLEDEILIMNGSRAVANGSRAIVNSQSIVDGTALLNGSRAVANGSRAVANGSRAIANSGIIDGTSNTNAVVVVHQTDTSAIEHPDSTFSFIPTVGITGLTAGEHAIIPATFLSSNFEVYYENGELIIDPYELTVKPNDSTYVYGTTPQPYLIISGIQYDDSLHHIIDTSNMYYSIDNEGNPGVGTHLIYPEYIDFLEGTSYVLNIENGTFTVTPANLYLQPINTSRPVGFNNPSFNYIAVGLQYNDHLNNIFYMNPDITTTAVLNSPAGTYPITMCCADAFDYIVNYTDGELTITPPPDCLIYEPNEGSFEIAAVDPGVGYTVDWDVSGTNWAMELGENTPFALYSRGATGTLGIFTFSIRVTSTNELVNSCTYTITSVGAGGGSAKVSHPSMSEKEEVTIYPNPTSNMATISFFALKDKHIQMEICDINGRRVKKLLDKISTTTDWQMVQADCSSLESGIYFLRMKSDEDIIVKKLVVIDN